MGVGVVANVAYYAASILLEAGQKDLATEVLTKALESNARFVFRSQAGPLLQSLKAE